MASGAFPNISVSRRQRTKASLVRKTKEAFVTSSDPTVSRTEGLFEVPYTFFKCVVVSKGKLVDKGR